MRLCNLVAWLAAGLILALIFPSLAFAADSHYQRYAVSPYTVSHIVTVSNNSDQPIAMAEITVPLINTKQPVYQEIVDEVLLPAPDRIDTKANGERYAVYELGLLRPGESSVFELRYLLDSFAVSYSLRADLISGDKAVTVSDEYLKPETHIETENPQIIAFAQEIAAGETNPYLLARKVFSEVNLHLTYGFNGSLAGSALDALLTRQGTCKDYTALFVAVMRVLGVPARQQTGYLYLPDLHSSSPYLREEGYLDLFYMPHTWAEFYLEGIGWIPADPTFTYMADFGDGPQKLVDWGYFAAINPNQRHIYFSEGQAVDNINYTFSSAGGDLSVAFSARMYFGALQIPFNDIADHWANADISYLYGYKSPAAIRGVSDGVYGADDTVTRAELATVLYRLAGLSETGKSKFIDVPINHWAYTEITAIADKGYMVGKSESRFNPADEITRAEMAVVLTRFFRVSGSAIPGGFTDLDGADYARSAINALYASGLAGGVAPGLFAPLLSITRSEMAAMLARALRRNL